MHKIKFKVRGDTWRAIFLTEEEFLARAEHSSEYEGAAAVTRIRSRSIIFDLSEFNNTVVKHEVWHAFSSTLYVDSANLSFGQLEEVNADLFASNTKQLLEVSRLLYSAGRDSLKKARRA